MHTLPDQGIRRYGRVYFGPRGAHWVLDEAAFCNITAMIAVSVTAQLAAIPLYIASAKTKAE